jgi:Holliday junction DNA helicase RuvA
VKLQDELSERRASTPVSEAVSALVNLGYGEIQASAAVAAAVRAAGDKAKTEELIRHGLKELAR